MLEFIAVLAAAIAVFYVALSLPVFVRQSSYVYAPDRDVGMTPTRIDISYEDVRLQTEDGETIAGWFIPAYGSGEVVKSDGNIAGTTALMCHGNAGDIGDRLDSILVFHKWRMNVFIFDYRGYGDSTGTPSEQGTYQDAMTAWKYLTRTRSIPPDHILIYGRSMGTAIAAWLANEVSPPVLVLESGFTSAPDMAAHMFPFLPARLVCRFRYDTPDLINKIRCPVLVAHSPNDETVPFKHGKRIFDNANRPKEFIELVGGHNDGGLDADTKYQRALKEFLVKHLGHTGPRQTAIHSTNAR